MKKSNNCNENLTAVDEVLDMSNRLINITNNIDRYKLKLHINQRYSELNAGEKDKIVKCFKNLYKKAKIEIMGSIAAIVIMVILAVIVFILDRRDVFLWVCVVFGFMAVTTFTWKPIQEMLQIQEMLKGFDENYKSIE